MQEAEGKAHITPAGMRAVFWHEEHFSQLRRDVGIADDFLNTGWDYSQLEKGGGKGGTLMAFLWGKYIVKELSQGDHRALLEITPSYVSHLRNGSSLLCSVFMHYRNVETGRIFFVMKNEIGNGPFNALYDLKGCADDKALELNGKSVAAVHKRIWNLRMWCGRCAWSDQRRYYYQGKQDAAHLSLHMTPEQRSALVEQLRYDTDWLGQHHLMDYSLLVALKNEDTASDRSNLTQPGASKDYVCIPGGRGAHNKQMLSISIIDFLQKWTCGKRIARGLKVFECNKATVPPGMYAKRFQRHFEKCFVASDMVIKLVGRPQMEQDNTEEELKEVNQRDAPVKVGKKVLLML